MKCGKLDKKPTFFILLFCLFDGYYPVINISSNDCAPLYNISDIHKLPHVCMKMHSIT
jgi:hypothetical protein